MSIFHIITLIRHRQPQQLSKFERSEVEQQQFDKIKEIIEAKVTYNKVDIEKVASELRIPAKKLNTLVRKYTGFTFNNYLMFCRTEIAKERLRSSHCSEASIAETCGFSSVNELEKYFLRFHHTTPYKFRTEQQVA
jgi:transcriptional regulator GlxA family with amidase domain